MSSSVSRKASAGEVLWKTTGSSSLWYAFSHSGAIEGIWSSLFSKSMLKAYSCMHLLTMSIKPLINGFPLFWEYCGTNTGCTTVCCCCCFFTSSSFLIWYSIWNRLVILAYWLFPSTGTNNLVFLSTLRCTYGNSLHNSSKPTCSIRSFTHPSFSKSGLIPTYEFPCMSSYPMTSFFSIGSTLSLIEYPDGIILIQHTLLSFSISKFIVCNFLSCYEIPIIL